MSDDFRPRRRLSNADSPRRSGGGNGTNPWVITIFAAIVVIIGGWFLGQALARVFNGPPKTEQVAQAPTPLPVVTPPSSPSPAATIAASATPAATATPKPKPSPEPSPTATAKVTIAPSATIAPAATATPAAAPVAAPAAAPTAAPAPPESPGTRVVRAYIDALRRGDPATASTYLGNGSPDESFIDSATRISRISSARNDDGSYKISVDMQTAQGEYYETFTVASDKILDKTAIKP